MRAQKIGSDAQNCEAQYITPLGIAVDQKHPLLLGFYVYLACQEHPHPSHDG